MEGVGVLEAVLIVVNALQFCFLTYLTHKERLATSQREEIREDVRLIKNGGTVPHHRGH